MSDHGSTSAFRLFEMFPTAEAARNYLEARRWPNMVVCPLCHEKVRITTRKSGFYRCNACKEDFTVRTRTIFGRSHIPLHKWLYALYTLMTTCESVSSLQLSKDIGITQKSAWSMLYRIREACGDYIKKHHVIVEGGKMCVGCQKRSEQLNKDIRRGRGKTGMIGMRNRSGRKKAKPIAP